MGHYTKGLAVEAGGSLEVHGQKKLAWTRLTQTLSPTSAEEVTIRIEDIPVGWEAGDRLVIASTDFDMNQVRSGVAKKSGIIMSLIKAEEVEIVNCAPCAEFVTCSCTVRAVGGQIKYEHFAEIYKGLVLIVFIDKMKFFSFYNCQ